MNHDSAWTKRWKAASLRWQAAKEQFDRIQKELNEAKDALSTLAPEGFEDDAIALKFVERKGNVDYHFIVTKYLPDLDVEPFRGKGSTYYTVSVQKV